MENRSSLYADGLLLLATIAWGITFPLIKNAVAYVHPSVFVALRFSLAALILLPFVLRSAIAADIKTFLSGLCIGVLNCGVYFTQTKGMETISAAEGAFITGLSVLFVPLLLPLFKMGKPQLKDFICSLICLLGIFILTDAGFATLQPGVYWVIAGSIFSAIAILTLQKCSQHNQHLDAMAFFQVLGTVMIISPLSVGSSYFNAFAFTPLISIIFCALFATSFALVVQTRYQRMTSPSRAALIFALEPVFATFFGYFINGTPPTWRTLLGGGIILLSILASELWPKKSRI